jgi:hypothetical protein
MNISVPSNAVDFLGSSIAIDFSKRTLIDGVNV